VIDPALMYPTFIGGAGEDPFKTGSDLKGVAVDIDSAGAVYAALTFTRTSTEEELLVAKFAPRTYALVYMTYFGGSAIEHASDIAATSDGSAYVTGLGHSVELSVSERHSNGTGRCVSLPAHC
jgi:hypothetical protein